MTAIILQIPLKSKSAQKPLVKQPQTVHAYLCHNLIKTLSKMDDLVEIVTKVEVDNMWTMTIDNNEGDGNNDNEQDLKIENVRTVKIEHVQEEELNPDHTYTEHDPLEESNHDEGYCILEKMELENLSERFKGKL